MSEWERRAEEFTEKISREFYLTWSGQKEKLEIEPIYQEYEDLFSEKVVQEKLSVITNDPPASRYIAAMATGEHLETQVKKVSEEISNSVLSATVEWKGKEIPYLQVSVILVNEPDWKNRHELESLAIKVDAKLSSKRKGRLEQMHERAKALGFRDYVDLYNKLQDVDLRAQAEWLQDFLDKTQEEYERQLFYFLAKAGVPPEEATPSDIGFIMRSKEFDHYFEGKRMVPALLETLKASGLSKGDDLPFTLDLEPRPKKSPRAFCAPVRVPDEVYLVIKPHGGRDDWDAFLHEAGHAEHFSHVPPNLPFPVRVLGDNDLIEVYSFHMQYRMLEPSWIRDVAGMPSPDIERYMALARFSKLFLLRRYVAKLQYELTLHGDGLKQAEEMYKSILERALLINIAPEKALSDVDDGFYSAQYLRAWVFEAMLRGFLRKELGDLWWRHPDSGDLLYQWWRRGQTKALPELLPEIGYSKLELSPLISDVLE